MKKTIQRLWNSSALPQSIDFWLKQVKCNFQLQTPTVKVVDKSFFNDVVKLVLKPSKKCHAFIAGQHLRLKVDIDGIGAERCYSIANLPSKRGFIELFVKVQGKVSTAIRDQVSIGDVLDVSQPFGVNHDKTYDLFVAGGIGITAMWPLFLHQQQQNPNAKLIYLTRTQDLNDVVLFNEIRQTKAYVEGRVVITEGRETLSSETGLNNYLSNVKRLITCGSESFNLVVKDRVSAFESAIEVDFESFKSFTTAEQTTERKEFKITLLNSKTEVVVDNRTPLLDSLLNAGIKPEYGCKQGICHQCTCRVSPATVLNGISTKIQLCTTFPSQEMELEL